MPFGLVLLVWAALQSRHAAESAGFLVGLGFVLIVIGFVHRNDVPCGNSGRLVVSSSGPDSASCGGFEAAPWFAAGAGAAILGLVIYGVYSLRSSRGATG
jgi:hypothetical protein